VPVLALVWKSHNATQRLRTAIALALPILILAAYLTYNRVSVGVFMPTSGSTKAGLSIAENLRSILTLVMPGRWSQSPDEIYSELFMRVFQMLAPMFVCGMYLIRRVRSGWGIIDALCAGVLLKGAYNFINVWAFHQGSWYFGSSIFVANFVIALFCDRTLSLAHPKQKLSRFDPWMATCVCGLVTAITFNIYANHYMSHGGGTWQASILVQRDALREMVESQGSDRFIEMNDGELAYSTRLQALSGQGLVLDPAAASALKYGHFFELAAARGYSLLMASGFYKDMFDTALERRKQGSRESIFMFSDAEFERFNVTPVAYDPISQTRLYRISRKP